MKMNRRVIATLTVLAAVAGAWTWLSPAQAEGEKKADAAVERTKKTVRMLDDIYKSTVVLITKHYVNDDNDLPAGTAAIALFDAVKKKGWHEVRLLDATGEPYDEKNVANDDFEKEATRRMKAGDAWYDQIVERKGKRYLRAATPIPVVLEKCTMCHSHYEHAAKGEAIGLLSYTIPIE